MSDIEHITSIVIARARDEYGQSNAAFDWAVAVGREQVQWCIDNAIGSLANDGLPEIQQGDGEAELQRRIDNTARLRQRIQPALDRYVARCKARKYTGWSSASAGPIRYAK